MLPSTRRVPKKLFQEVLEKGKSYHSDHFSLRIVKIEPPKTEQLSRFAFSIPKKLDTRATRRNYVRRKGVAILKPLLPAIPDGWVGIFFAKPNSLSLSTEDFSKEITFLLKKV